MEVAELQEKIREVYKLINYQNIEFEWNEQLKQARKILNEIQSKLHQPTVIGRFCKECGNTKMLQGNGIIEPLCTCNTESKIFL